MEMSIVLNLECLFSLGSMSGSCVYIVADTFLDVKCGYLCTFLNHSLTFVMFEIINFDVGFIPVVRFT